ncbi:hypothetical protein LTR66_006621 [Elasticomyces elasticus]|nr:hypothetical protein LTR66_006621 [Elasticomyces elasticus]
MGPQEVDITGYNPIVELAKETGTPLHRWKGNTLLVDSDGNLVSSDEANEALKQVWDILEKAITHSTNHSEEIPSSASLYNFFRDWCDRTLQSGEMTEREVELVLGMSQMWGAYVGDRVERQSLKFFYLEDCIEGDDCFIPTSYEKIMAKVSAIPLEKARIQLNTVMTSIEVRTSGALQICVTTSDGKVQYFDDVVVTTPLGWLKQHKKSIPQMHPRVVSAIDAMSYGRLEKILIEFPTAFWECVTAGSGTGPNEPVSFVHWLSPSYAAQTNPQRWRLECVSFHAFAEPYRRNILLFYTFGDCSTHITTSVRGLHGEPRDRWLQQFFEPYYTRLPNYDANTCAPLRFLATEWCNDEFAGNGGYTNFRVGMADAAQDVQAIRHGMPEQHIYFAGEHTAPFDGLGTVAGAYNSGEKVARRIIESGPPAEAMSDNSAEGSEAVAC